MSIDQDKDEEEKIYVGCLIFIIFLRNITVTPYIAAGSNGPNKKYCGCEEKKFKTISSLNGLRCRPDFLTASKVLQGHPSA